jgi:2-polyprenyl-6-methoxyphenol hydroxylase-like FAD-dependent oxidoreductase
VDVEVAIAGAGPTGLALAAELCRRGIRPLVLDRLEAGANTSRAAVIHARTLEVLEPLGITSHLFKSGLKVSIFRVRDRGKILTSIGFENLPTKFPFALMCPQDRTERILIDRLQEFGGSVTRPCEVVSVSESERGVEVQYRWGETVHKLITGWLIACDGSHSTVREQAGIPFEGDAYDESFILADVEMDWPLGQSEVSLFLSSKGLVVVAPLPSNHFRIVATVEQDSGTPLGLGDFQQILDERGPDTGSVQIGSLAWASRFRVSHRLAHSLRKGRILLAGDAAHVHSPAGGQGMNTGIQDAVSLAEALGSAPAGGKESVLGRWQEERLNVARSVVQFTHRMTRLSTISSPALKELRNLALAFIGHVPYARHALAANLAELNTR